MSTSPTPIDDSDLALLLARGPQPGARECATGWALRQLHPDTAEKFRLLFANRAPHKDLAAAFAARGFSQATAQSIGRHMAGDCRNCPDRES